MAKDFTQNVIGIEINEEYIFLSQINEQNKNYILTKHKQINMPPRAIIEGLIADPDHIADQISTAIQENEFNATNIVIALNNNNFLKKTTSLPHLTIPETQVKIETLALQSPLLQNKDSQISFQKFSPSTKKTKESNNENEEKEDTKEKARDIIMYAALQTELIDNIEDLAKSLDMNLVSIDLTPLGTLRALQWDTKQSNDTSLLINVDYDYMDINFIYKTHVLLSRTLRNNISSIIEEELHLESYLSTMKHLFLEFSDIYPEFSPPTHCVVYTRTIEVSSLINQLSKELNITISEYKLTNTISIENNDLTDEQKNQLTKLYLPSIGLALKYYEPVNKTLSLTKIKKQLAPIFKKEILIKNLVFATTIIGIILASNIYIKTKINSIQNKLTLTQNQINVIQKGNKTGQRKQLGSLRKTIDFYESIRSQKDSKYLFFYNIISFLPNDITFSALNFNESKKISIQGEAYLKDSIYNFYSSLDKRYKHVKLSKIKTTKKNKNTINQFTIQFEWIRK
ncbi:hypothetical protein CL658_01095 [bacterium]|nr:hypothetical protein [bacterium]|tara:strand:- start:5173 stop:6711 length:1539 start_codon:yes stop_codon:yes gene_type:complete